MFPTSYHTTAEITFHFVAGWFTETVGCNIFIQDKMETRFKNCTVLGIALNPFGLFLMRQRCCEL